MMAKIVSFITLSLLLGCGSAVIYPQSCRYDRGGPTDGPGGHITVVKYGPSVKYLSGSVVDQAGEPIAETIVVLKRIVGKRKVYVGTAATNTNGYFCFGTLSPGQYVLETGGRGFNPLWTYIRVVSANSTIRRRWVRLEVEVGT